MGSTFNDASSSITDAFAGAPSPLFAQQLHCAVSAYYRVQRGELLHELRPLRSESRMFSTIWIVLARTNNNCRRLVVKTIRSHPSNASTTQEDSQATVEFAMLSRLFPQFSGVGRCSVPRPVALLAELNTFVMEECEGHILSDDLRYLQPFRSRNGFRILATAFHDCGRWLRHFQDFTGRVDPAPTCVEWIVACCESRLQMIEESCDPRISPDFRQRVVEFVDKLASEAMEQEISATIVHSDFGPWNILAHSSGVTVIDFFGSVTGALPVDLFKMMIHLETLEHGVFNDSRRVSCLRRQFLEGYGGLPQVASALALLCEAMQRIFVVAGVVMAKHGMFHRVRERNTMLRRNIHWLTRQPMPSIVFPKPLHAATKPSV